MRVPRLALAGLLAMGAIQPLTAQQSYSSSTAPTISYGFGASPGTGYLVGQTFTSTGGTLTAFGFYAASVWSGPATLQAFLYQMSGNSIVGSALYTSGAISYPSVSAGWLDFAVGNVGLTANNVYIAVLAPMSVTGFAVMDVGAESGDAYAGGAGVYSYGANPATQGSLQAATWNTLGGLTGKPGQDFALRLNYQGVSILDAPTTTAPEPVSLMLLGTGLVGLFGARRLMRKRV